MRIKLGALCNTARNDRRDRRRKSQQKEEFHQLKSIPLNQNLSTGIKLYAISNAITDKKIRYRRYSKIDDNFNQRIHLIFFTDRTQFQKCKTSMHRQNHDRSKQNK